MCIVIYVVISMIQKPNSRIFIQKLSRQIVRDDMKNWRPGDTFLDGTIPSQVDGVTNLVPLGK
jgi:hypothetical protein